MSNENESLTAKPNLQDLQGATIATALEFSELAYADRDPSTGALLSNLTSGTVDPIATEMRKAGWKEITGLREQNIAADHYQGIAFYKVINGVTEVVIANRGSAPALNGASPSEEAPSSFYDYTHSDRIVASSGSPKCDTDALQYYNAVIAWVNKPGNVTLIGGTPNPIDIIETGHSLGGEEADFVQVSVQKDTEHAHPKTRTVSFDAPGLPTGFADADATYDAVNIAARNEIVHVGGSLLNGGYAGSTVVVDAGAPKAEFQWSDLLGVALGSPMGAFIQGLSREGYAAGANLVSGAANHRSSVLSAYEATHPFLFGVDLQRYEPSQVNQTLATTLQGNSYAPGAYANETDAQKQTLYDGLVGAASQIPSTRSISEQFSSSSTGGSSTYTEIGGGGDSVTIVQSGANVTLDDNSNLHMVETYGPDGTLLSDTWQRGTDGIKGTDSFNADGSSNSLIM